MSARSANTNGANRSVDTIQVAQYDGKYSWRDYLVQFELAAHANKGDMQTSAVKLACTRVLQKVLSLGSDYFSATFYQTYFYYKPLKFSPLLKHIFVTFLPSREK